MRWVLPILVGLDRSRSLLRDLPRHVKQLKAHASAALLHSHLLSIYLSDLQVSRGSLPGACDSLARRV